MDKLVFLNIQKSNKYLYISILKNNTNIITISSNKKYFQTVYSINKYLKNKSFNNINNIIFSYMKEKMLESGIKYLFLNQKLINLYKNSFYRNHS